MTKHLDIKIRGGVQGVFFRSSAKTEAEKLDLVGFVKNEPNGSVYIEVEGEQQNLAIFLEWCKNGPDSAQVETIEVSEKNSFKNFNNFLIF